MNSIESQFVPYSLAVKLKELGFNQVCIAEYEDDDFYICDTDRNGYSINKSTVGTELVSAPLWQQAFEWFRVEHGLSSYVRAMDSGRSYWKINLLNKKGSVKGYSGFENEYELSKIKCLKELIKIFKNEI